MSFVRHRRSPLRARARRRGATMVEFAVVTPIVFLFFFAAFEFCRVAMIRHSADNAVYEACRKAAIPGSTADEAKQEARLIMNSIGVTDVNISVLPRVIHSDTRDVTIRIEVPLDKNSFVPNQFVGGKSIIRELTLSREGAR